MTTPWFYHLLACPDCAQEVVIDKDNVSCRHCDYVAHRRDLRPHDPRPLHLDFARKPPFAFAEYLAGIETSPPPKQYQGPQAAHRNSNEFMSVLAAYFQTPIRLLDLGCGPRDQEVPVTALGHDYVGVDIDSQSADFLADAHALPFKSGSLDCVFAYAVMLHIRNPFVALNEVERVLKPGGLFIGTIAQGEPFQQSYYHLTAWGLLALIATVPGLRLLRVWAANDTLGSLSRLGGYSRIIKKCLAMLNWLNHTFPILTPRKALWPKKAREIDALHRAGSIAFVIEKAG